VHDDVAVDLVLHARDGGCEVVAGDHRRVRPLGVGERGGDDVFRHRVELVGELAVALRPGGREALVRHASEQERLRGHRLVDLELVAGVAAVERERPAGVLVAVLAAG
jgi:hypothetical protein